MRAEGENELKEGTKEGERKRKEEGSKMRRGIRKRRDEVGKMRGRPGEIGNETGRLRDERKRGG